MANLPLTACTLLQSESMITIGTTSGMVYVYLGLVCQLVEILEKYQTQLVVSLRTGLKFTFNVAGLPIL